MADQGQEVEGIALGLGLDTSEFSSGIARAKAELTDFLSTARKSRVSVGATAAERRPAQPAVAPVFSASKTSVRGLRTDINQHFRVLAAQGEAVSVPIKLGRIPFATLRREIQTGIGEVPVRIRVDTSSLRGQASLIAAIMSTASGTTMGRATTNIQAAAASRGLPIPHRATGGYVTGGRVRGGTDLAKYPAEVMERNLRAIASQMSRHVDPEHRGRGIANAMYVKAQRFAGASVVPDSYRTGEGMALWNQQNRPFGRGQHRRSGGPVFRQVDPETFSRHIGMASQKYYKDQRGRTRRIGETVYVYPPDEYKHMRTYLDRSGESGYAIKPDGDLVSVFNAGERGTGRGKQIVRSAVQRGATKLDAFDESGFLPHLYSRYGGFRETGRDPWNPDYAPPGWRGDKPDVVYMQRQQRQSKQHRYRGGPALRDVYPNANIHLGALPRGKRLEVGRELLGLGQDYPSTAQQVNEIRAMRPGAFGAYMKLLYPHVAGENPARDIAAITHESPFGRTKPTIRINAGMGDSDIAALGALPKTVADMVVHEFGHAIDRSFGEVSEEMTPQLLSMRQPSPYSNAGIKEHFAELFLEHRRGISSQSSDVFGALSTLSKQHARHRVAGGWSGAGPYVVGELGKELFVPSYMSGLIPPDVMGQIPMRASGGMVEVPSGPTLWEPPEDGIIVPNRLMNKVPRFATGRQPRQHNLPWQDAQGRWRNPDGTFRTPAPTAPAVPILNQTGGHTDEFLKFIKSAQDRMAAASSGGLPTGGADMEEHLRNADAAAMRSAARGLTGQSSLGGLFSFFLGGGQQRKLAAAQAQVYGQEYKQFLPQGVKSGTDPILLFGDRVNTSAKVVEELSGRLKTLQKGTSEYSITQEHLTKAQKVYADNVTALNTASELRLRHDKALAESEGGLVRNFAATTVAGVAFNVGSQAVTTALSELANVTKPAVDQMLGFTAASQKQTQALAQQLPQAGTLQTLFGQTGVASGLGYGATQQLQGVLGQSVYAKAGATAAGAQGGLYEAAKGALNGAPTGLYGGYGGVLGGGAFAQNLGGGTGFAETVADTVAKNAGQNGGGFIGDMADRLGRGLGVVGSATVNPSAGVRIQDGKLVQVVPVTSQQQQAQQQLSDSYIGNFNEAIGRSLQQRGSGDKMDKLVSVGVGSSDALAVIASNVDDYTKQMAAAGVVFKDAVGSVVTNQDELTKTYSEAARGFTLPDQKTFLQANRQQLAGAEQVTGAQTALARGLTIPAQLAQTVTANPFAPAASGLATVEERTGRVALGFKSAIAPLEQTQKLQDDIARQAQATVYAQAQFIGQNVDAGSQASFMSGMADVQGYGKQITSLNTQLANRQALLGGMQYANNLRLINRSVADAAGLLTGTGNSLGALQRQQWDIGRQSQLLSMELSQRQINFQTAVAGFQAPGVTGQERAARMAEARVEASYSQRQLNLQRQGFGVEGRIFFRQAGYGVEDVARQKALLVAQYGLEQEQIAVSKRVAVLTAAQAQSQAKAQALFDQATGNFNGRLNLAGQYVSQFGGDLSTALAEILKALGITTQQQDTLGGTSSGRHAAGIVGLTTGPYTATFGEAGTEAVAIVRAPTKAQLGAVLSPSASAGVGGSVTMNVSVSGNTFGQGMDAHSIAREIASEVADEVERRFNWKAKMNMRGAG